MVKPNWVDVPICKNVTDRDGARIKVRVGGGILNGVTRQTVFIEKRYDDLIWLTATQARNLAAALTVAADVAEVKVQENGR